MEGKIEDKKMKKIFLIIQVLALVFILSCKKKGIPIVSTMQQRNEAMQTATSPDKNLVQEYVPAQTEYDVVAMCPVSGDKLSVGKDTKGVKYKGKVFYMCCPACLEQFKNNPEKYAK